MELIFPVISVPLLFFKSLDMLLESQRWRIWRIETDHDLGLWPSRLGIVAYERIDMHVAIQVRRD